MACRWAALLGSRSAMRRFAAPLPSFQRPSQPPSKQVLEADSGNAKALYRRAQAWLATEDWVEAELDIRAGLAEVGSSVFCSFFAIDCCCEGRSWASGRGWPRWGLAPLSCLAHGNTGRLQALAGGCGQPRAHAAPTRPLLPPQEPDSTDFKLLLKKFKAQQAAKAKKEASLYRWVGHYAVHAAHVVRVVHGMLARAGRRGGTLPHTKADSPLVLLRSSSAPPCSGMMKALGRPGPKAAAAPPTPAPAAENAAAAANGEAAAAGEAATEEA